MAFTVQTALRQSAGTDSIVYLLSDPAKGVSAEIRPANGFNCLSWQVGTPEGSAELLYVAPDWDINPVPTRSGIPILFPFPNRIRQGRFHFAGHDYQLHLNCSQKKHAIHGYALRHPWRVIERGITADSAFITGEFRGSLDAPAWIGMWPADYTLRLTYRLSATVLRVEVKVTNPDTKDLPFGFGLHPYFRLPGSEANVSDYWVELPATAVWELDDYLPTGTKLPIEGALDFRRPRRIGEAVLDTLYSDVGTGVEFRRVGRIGRVGAPGALELWTSQHFREFLVFTPPHRQAIALEPYTCPTDAVNLTAHGHEVGWKVLGPGRTAEMVVEFRWNPDEPAISDQSFEERRE